MAEFIPLLLFLTALAVLMIGYPVAFSLAGTALLFAGVGLLTGHFDSATLEALPSGLYGIMINETLVAVPLFVFMGVLLERSRVAEELLDTMAMSFGSLRGGLGIAVTLAGMLLTASTGIVGATVVTMGLVSLPNMLRRNYDPGLSAGIVCASGTLGQILPPSIVLVILGVVLSAAYQQAQLEMGIWSPETISVADLFVGALIPGLLLVLFYLAYLLLLSWIRPSVLPASPEDELAAGRQGGLWLGALKALLPPLLLIVAVLGSIIGGLATPAEAASIGAVGAILLALARGSLTLTTLRDVMRKTTLLSSMVFMILIGASIFSLVFRGYGGDWLVSRLFNNLPGGVVTAVLVVMLIVFLLGFMLSYIEITFLVVPIVGPVLLAMGLDPVWLGIMMVVNLQASLLTPPYGLEILYLRGVAPPELTTVHLYRGVIPFVLIQLLVLGLIAGWPALATWLPETLLG